MPVLFDREFVINASGIRVASRFKDQTRNEEILKVSFRVERSLQKDPSRAKISIYNLNPDNRALFQTKNTPIEVESGYKDNVSQIFGGTIDFATNTLDGTDWITSIDAGDGTREFKEARISSSFKGKVSIERAIRAAADALGYKPGNLDEKLRAGPLRSKATEFSKGVSLKGKAEQVLDKYIKAYGYQWSVQDGSFLLLGPKEVLGQRVIVLRPDTGLIGAPEAGEDGFINFRSLLQPELLPARQVRVESFQDDVNGDFRIERVVFTGDTWGNDWYADVEASPL
jgi:hypothetical protein